MKRFSCDLQLDADSGLATVAEYLSKTPHLRRAKLEESLVSFYLPEALFNCATPLTKRQQWQIRNAIYVLEKQLKLYHQFYSSNLQTKQFHQLEQQAKETFDPVSQLTQHSSSNVDLDDSDADDDFSDAGI